MTGLPNWALEVKNAFVSKLEKDTIKIKTCPYCGNQKFNLEISITKCVFHCWTCDVGGSIQKFLIAQSITFEKEDIRPSIERTKEDSVIELPENEPLLHRDSTVAGLARGYLHSRGVTTETIVSWDMRLAISDAWFGHILVPFYGLKGLEYFVGVKFRDGGGYRLPFGSKDRWVPKQRKSNSIVLCEGLFDGINVWQNTSFDILILLGKFVLDYQVELLKRCGYDRVYICLDGDALSEANKMARRLFRMGIQVYLTMLPKGYDPDDMKEQIQAYLDTSIVYGQTTYNRIKRMNNELQDTK